MPVIICWQTKIERLLCVETCPHMRSARLRWLSVPPRDGNPTKALSSAINAFRPGYLSKKLIAGHSFNGITSSRIPYSPLIALSTFGLSKNICFQAFHCPQCPRHARRQFVLPDPVPPTYATRLGDFNTRPFCCRSGTT